MKHFATAVGAIVISQIAFYSIVLFPIFQWRNPKANEMSFFRDFQSIVLLKKLEKYQ